VKATFFIMSDAFTWGSTNMTAAQVRTMISDGHEIGNHTRSHANLTSLSATAARAQFADAQRVIAQQTGVTPKNCAYPYGASNSTVRSIAAEFFTSCRGTSGGQNALGGGYDLRTFYVTTSTSASAIRTAADAAKANNAWLVLTYHNVGIIESSDDVSTATLQAHVDAVKASGVPIRTVAQVLG
jgi:peptidoglycan/xylan/chitin deacetylase (PgdA/CDA1 family)